MAQASTSSSSAARPGLYILTGKSDWLAFLDADDDTATVDRNALLDRVWREIWYDEPSDGDVERQRRAASEYLRSEAFLGPFPETLAVVMEVDGTTRVPLTFAAVAYVTVTPTLSGLWLQMFFTPGDGSPCPAFAHVFWQAAKTSARVLVAEGVDKTPLGEHVLAVTNTGSVAHAPLLLVVCYRRGMPHDMPWLRFVQKVLGFKRLPPGVEVTPVNRIFQYTISSTAPWLEPKRTKKNAKTCKKIE